MQVVPRTSKEIFEAFNTEDDSDREYSTGSDREALREYARTFEPYLHEAQLRFAGVKFKELTDLARRSILGSKCIDELVLTFMALSAPKSANYVANDELFNDIFSNPIYLPGGRSAHTIRTQDSQIKELAIIKTANRNDKDTSHEALIGMRALNKMRSEIPNFSCILGFFDCGSPFYGEKGLVNICEPSRTKNIYTIYEYIPNIGNLQQYYDNPDVSTHEALLCYTQILLALRAAHSRYKFTHHDANMGNVVIRRVSKQDIYIPYQTHRGLRYLRSPGVVPTFIDYDFSYVEIDGQEYPMASNYTLGPRLSKPNIMSDVFRITVSAAWSTEWKSGIAAYVRQHLLPFFCSDVIDKKVIGQLGKVYAYPYESTLADFDNYMELLFSKLAEQDLVSYPKAGSQVLQPESMSVKDVHSLFNYDKQPSIPHSTRYFLEMMNFYGPHDSETQQSRQLVIQSYIKHIVEILKHDHAKLNSFVGYVSDTIGSDKETLESICDVEYFENHKRDACDRMISRLKEFYKEHAEARILESLAQNRRLQDFMQTVDNLKVAEMLMSVHAPDVARRIQSNLNKVYEWLQSPLTRAFLKSLRLEKYRLHTFMHEAVVLPNMLKQRKLAKLEVDDEVLEQVIAAIQSFEQYLGNQL